MHCLSSLRMRNDAHGRERVRTTGVGEAAWGSIRANIYCMLLGQGSASLTLDFWGSLGKSGRCGWWDVAWNGNTQGRQILVTVPRLEKRFTTRSHSQPLPHLSSVPSEHLVFLHLLLWTRADGNPLSVLASFPAKPGWGLTEWKTPRSYS